MTPADPPAADAPRPLPRREPRPLATHALVDTAVAFLLLALLFFFVGLPFWLTIVVSILVGVGVAPLTRRAEERALAQRPVDPGT